MTHFPAARCSLDSTPGNRALRHRVDVQPISRPCANSRNLIGRKPYFRLEALPEPFRNSIFPFRIQDLRENRAGWFFSGTTDATPSPARSTGGKAPRFRRISVTGDGKTTTRRDWRSEWNTSPDRARSGANVFRPRRNAQPNASEAQALRGSGSGSGPHDWPTRGPGRNRTGSERGPEMKFDASQSGSAVGSRSSRRVKISRSIASISTRASCAPRQKCAPVAPKATW